MHALDCGEAIRDHAEPSNGDCQQIVGAALALAFSDRRKVEWRTEPSSWREPLRTSAIAGKAPNARVQRGREWYSENPCERRFAASAATPC